MGIGDKLGDMVNKAKGKMGDEDESRPDMANDSDRTRDAARGMDDGDRQNMGQSDQPTRGQSDQPTRGQWDEPEEEGRDRFSR